MFARTICLLCLHPFTQLTQPHVLLVFSHCGFATSNIKGSKDILKIPSKNACWPVSVQAILLFCICLQTLIVSDALFTFMHLYYDIFKEHTSVFKKTECKKSCLIVQNGVPSGAHELRDLVLWHIPSLWLWTLRWDALTHIWHPNIKSSWWPNLTACRPLSSHWPRCDLVDKLIGSHKHNEEETTIYYLFSTRSRSSLWHTIRRGRASTEGKYLDMHGDFFIPSHFGRRN